MIHITLPAECRRAAVRGFGCVLSAGLGAAVAGVGWALNWPPFAALGALVVITAVPIAFFQEQRLARLYRIWNKRVARPISGAMTRYVLAICYYIIFVAAGRSGSRLDARSAAPVASAWKSRLPLTADAYRATFAASDPGQTRGGWIRNYLAWAGRSGNSWAIILIPFLIILRVFSPEEEAEVSGNIYTLF
jgi:hypothetical protein